MRSVLCLCGLSVLIAGCHDAPSAASAVSGPSQTPASAEATADIAHWQCGELLVDTRVEADAIGLSFSGRRLRLPRRDAATGARYADDAGNVFADQTNAAILTLSDDGQRDCTPSARPSPWTEAADRGIRFRATGSEPGWMLEIGPGGAPSLHAALDYGQRQLDIAQMQPAALGYRGESGNGTTVAISIQRIPCRDGMSGESFEASVTLHVDDTTYQGCGAFLDD